MHEENDDSSSERAGAGPVQVLPFIHHLKSLGYLSSFNFNGNTSNNNTSIDDDGNSSQQLKLDPSLFEEDDDAEVVENEFSNTKFLSAAKPSSKRNKDSELKILSENTNNEKIEDPKINNKALILQNEKPFWELDENTKTSSLGKNKSKSSSKHFISPSIYGWSHPVATSMMLSRLNPDAQVTVVHHSKFVKQCAEFYGVRNQDYFELYGEFKEKKKLRNNNMRSQERLETEVEETQLKLDIPERKSTEKKSRVEEEAGGKSAESDRSRSATSPLKRTKTNKKSSKNKKKEE